MAEELAHVRMAVESHSRVVNLEDRFDRHLNKVEETMNRLSDKIDAMNEKLTDARLQQVKDDRETNIKLYTVNGIISGFIAWLTAWLSTAFKN